jgi:hypothetical protein
MTTVSDEEDGFQIEAPDYVSRNEYESTRDDTTARELAKLHARLAEGGDYVNLLSPKAKTAVSKTLHRISQADLDYDRDW